MRWLRAIKCFFGWHNRVGVTGVAWCWDCDKPLQPSVPEDPEPEDEDDGA